MFCVFVRYFYVTSSFVVVLIGKRGWLLCLVCLPGVS